MKNIEDMNYLELTPLERTHLESVMGLNDANGHWTSHTLIRKLAKENAELQERLDSTAHELLEAKAQLERLLCYVFALDVSTEPPAQGDEPMSGVQSKIERVRELERMDEADEMVPPERDELNALRKTLADDAEKMLELVGAFLDEVYEAHSKYDVNSDEAQGGERIEDELDTKARRLKAEFLGEQ